MASAQDLLTSIQSIYPYIDTGGNLMNELQRRAGEGTTSDQILNDAPGYSEVNAGARSAADSIYKPQYDLAQNQLAVSGQQINQDQTDVNRNYDTLGDTLRTTAANSASGLKENFNNLGLLQSGLTAAGLGDIQKNLGKDTANSEADRASKLAGLALQRAGLSIQGAQAANTYQGNVNDYVTKLLTGSQAKKAQNDQQSFDNTLKLYTLAQSIPAGQSVSVGGQTVQGMKGADLSPVDLGDRVAFVDGSGKVVNVLSKGSTPGSASAADPFQAFLSQYLAGLDAGGGDSPVAPAGNSSGSGTSADDLKLLNDFSKLTEPANDLGTGFTYQPKGPVYGPPLPSASKAPAVQPFNWNF